MRLNTRSPWRLALGACFALWLLVTASFYVTKDITIAFSVNHVSGLHDDARRSLDSQFNQTDGGVEEALPVGQIPVKALLIVVPVDTQNLRGLGRAAWYTWIRELRNKHQVLFFVFDCHMMKRLPKEDQLAIEPLQPSIVCLNNSTLAAHRQPSQRALTSGEKEVLVWEYIAESELPRFQWFLKVHKTSYLNGARLDLAIKEVTKPIHLGTPKYYGQPMRTADGKYYCISNAYLLNNIAVKKLAPSLWGCLASTKQGPGDEEFGQCLDKGIGVQCEKPPRGKVVALSYQEEHRKVYPHIPNRNSASGIAFPEVPKQVHFDAIAVGPMRKSSSFYKFRDQQVKYLRPPLTAIQRNIPKGLTEYQTKLYERARSETEKSCVNSPTRQHEINKFSLPECRPLFPDPNRNIKLPETAYVITSKTNRKLRKRIADYGINVVSAPVKNTTKEKAVRGYLKTMKAVFTIANRKKAERIMILEDNVVFRCDFLDKVTELLGSPRCGGYMRTASKGGVLLLGAQEWHHEAVNLRSRDIAKALKISKIGKDADLCYNHHHQTKGSFSGIYHRSVFGSILSWLEKNRDTDKSFDEVFASLKDEGYIVRVAYPYLSVLDVSKKPKFSLGVEVGSTLKSAEQRAQAYGWQMTSYCDYLEYMV